MSTNQINVAIIGPGNIGLDLMYKIKNCNTYMHLALMIGNESSKRLHIARNAQIATTDQGVDAVLERDDIKIVFDATTAAAHFKHASKLRDKGKVAIDLTPAAVGAFVCPPVNIDAHIDDQNINLITCGGQATIPIVAAIKSVTHVRYAEIVSCIARDSAGPGTRNSIDEFTQTTANALRTVGGAEQSKAIILLNPSVPPMLMNNTIYCIVEDIDEPKIIEAINNMVKRVQSYVPGYRLKMPPLIDGNKVTIMIEIEGAGAYLPAYSGNLDIETSSALAIGELVAKKMLMGRGVN